MIHFQYHSPGTPPGLLLPRNEETTESHLSLISYSHDGFNEIQQVSIEQIKKIRESQKIHWLNVQGLGNVKIIQEIGKLFDLHPLALEDVANLGQRPRVDIYDNQIFIISGMVYFKNENELTTEQLSIFLGKDYVITFQEAKGPDFFEKIRERIRIGKGFIRRMKADYLVYAILDAVVDSFYPILELIGDHLELLEEEMLTNPSKKSITKLYDAKRLLLQVRREAWPHREIFSTLLRDELGFIRRDTFPFFRDCYEHITQILDIVENYRDLAAGLMDLYLSSVGMRTNEIMRILTLVSTFFIPLTFLAGVYGMNFDLESPYNMPELKFPFGYIIFWIACFLISLGMFVFYRRKKWL